MNCRVVESKLSAFVDGELGGREMIAVRDHCHQCPACAEELQMLRTTKLTMQGLSEVEVPEGLLARLEERVRIEARPARASKPILSFALFTAAAAMTVLVTLNVVRGEKSPEATATYAETVDFSQDQAVIEAGDPLSGPAPVYLVGNGR